MKFSAACAVFCLPPTTTWAAVRAAYRQRAARAAHPDHNDGDRAAWDELQRAYQTLREALDRPRHCPACHGSGVRAVQRRGKLVSESCNPCRGRGVPPEET